jgi:hypothetical protein
MNKDRFLQLHRWYCLDTSFLSYTMIDHPAYIELLTLNNEYGIIWALERLKDTISHDLGDDFDATNSPWLSTQLISEYTNGTCWDGFPNEYAGMLNEIRSHLLQWGKIRYEAKNAR